MNRSLTVFLLLAAGCQSRVTASSSGQTSADASTGDTGTKTPLGATGSPGPTSATNPSADPEGTSTTTSTAEPGTFDGGCFLCSPDAGPDGNACSIWSQNCPAGETCRPWADDGGSAWTAFRCVPLDPTPDAVGESCTAEGATGIDSCGPGAMCWDVDPETGEGTCTPQCTGSEQAPACGDPNRQCYVSAEGLIALCLLSCDPLDPGACPDGEGCYRFDDNFVCDPDLSGDGGGLLESCDGVNTCDPGLACTQPVPDCPPDAPGCCLPFCDLDAPACPEGTSCAPPFPGGSLPAYPNAGVCEAAR